MEEKNCWNCTWSRSTPTTLLPICWWFVNKTGMTKEIPGRVVDVGCKFWTQEAIDFDALKAKLKTMKDADISQ